MSLNLVCIFTQFQTERIGLRNEATLSEILVVLGLNAMLKLIRPSSSNDTQL